MRQIFIENKEKDVDVNFMKQVFSKIHHLPVAKWYRGGGNILHLHIGELHPDQNTDIKGKNYYIESADYVFYLSGEWELYTENRLVLSSSTSPIKVDRFVDRISLRNLQFVEFEMNSLNVILHFDNNSKIRAFIQNDNWLGLHCYGKYALHLKDKMKKIFSKTLIILEE